MRVEQHHRFLSELVKDAEDGKMVPAGMQRPYVWREADVLAFCESLIERLPVGSLLTWRPAAGLDPAQMARPRLGPVRPETIDRHARLILDGQNRMATFAWMLGGDMPDDLSEAEIATWTGRVLVIDAETDGFLFVPEEEAEVGLRISAAACSLRKIQPLFRTGFARWTKEGYDEKTCDTFMQRVSDIADFVREARVIETVIDDASPEEAKSAFLKICRAGVLMSEEDFDAAMRWVPPTA